MWATPCGLQALQCRGSRNLRVARPQMGHDDGLKASGRGISAMHRLGRPPQPAQPTPVETSSELAAPRPASESDDGAVTVASPPWPHDRRTILDSRRGRLIVLIVCRGIKPLLILLLLILLLLVARSLTFSRPGAITRSPGISTHEPASNLCERSRCPCLVAGQNGESPQGSRLKRFRRAFLIHPTRPKRLSTFAVSIGCMATRRRARATPGYTGIRARM